MSAWLAFALKSTIVGTLDGQAVIVTGGIGELGCPHGLSVRGAKVAVADLTDPPPSAIVVYISSNTVQMGVTGFPRYLASDSAMLDYPGVRP